MASECLMASEYFAVGIRWWDGLSGRMGHNDLCGPARGKTCVGQPGAKTMCGPASSKNTCGPSWSKNMCGPAWSKNMCGPV
eukprot:362204-Chlamydomonas_euryale.AAC.3